MRRNVEMTLFLASAPADLLEQSKPDGGKLCMITATVFANTKQDAVDTLSVLEQCPCNPACLRKTVAEAVTFENLVALFGGIWAEVHRNKIKNPWSTSRP